MKKADFLHRVIYKESMRLLMEKTMYDEKVLTKKRKNKAQPK